MKGFKDSKKKFHPIRDYKGVRKSRDQSVKEQGVKIERKKRARDKPNPYVTGKERKDVLKHFWFDKLTPNEQKIVFKDFKKDRIKFGYPPFQGDINEFREHEIYMVSAFGEEDENS